MRFGIQLPQEGVAFEEVLSHARVAESLGYDSVWIPDHLRPVASGTEAPECWTTLTAVLCGTERVRGGPLVLCESFRNPALLANMAATLDRISGGRLILGIGAGWYRDEFDAYGYSWSPGAERVERLREALGAIRAVWRGERFDGAYHRAGEKIGSATPLGALPIWVGGKGPELLRVAAEHADAWNAPVLAPGEVAERAATLAELCESIGRPSIDVTYEGPVWIGDEDRIARRVERNAASENPTLRTYARTAIAGTPEQVIARIREYEAAGVSHLVCHFGRTDDHRSTELFARAVMPAFGDGRGPMPPRA